MKALKIILIILLVLVVLFGGCAYLVFKNIDKLFIAAIEAIASESMQTEVTVDDVNISFSDGRGEIIGLNIANLPGYDEPRLFSLNKAALQIDASSLEGPVVVIEEILVDGARLTVEHKNLTETNLKEVWDNLQRNSEVQQQQGGEQMNFMIEKLVFSNITMDVISPEFENTTITLPDIRRENLGNRQTGLTGAELTEAVMAPLLESARKELEGKVQKEVEKQVGKQLQEALEEELAQ
ncbi:MAG TPA: hypothetical protein VIC08_05215 [Cellvibrionaceae bacterium]